MEIQQLITFHTIVQTGTFSAAAEKLGYSQAAVTIQIRKLEEELGEKLFDRLGRTVSLTGAGSAFLEHTIRILNDVSDAQESVSEKKALHGTLTIGTIDSLCTTLLIGPVENFHAEHPDVNIRITTDSIDGLIAMLYRNEVDFVYLADRKINDSNLICVSRQETKAVFVCASDHPLAEREKVTMEELAAYPLLLTEKDASYRRILEDYLAEEGLLMAPVIESRNTDMILAMVKDGTGITFLPDYMLSGALEEGSIALIRTDYRALFYRQMLCHRNKWVSREMKAFFEKMTA